MNNKIILVCLGLILCGCGKSSNSSKAVFSNWRNTATSAPLNLSGGQFDTPLLTDWIFTSGAICQADITVSGNNSSGVATITNSTYQGGGSGDPGCAALDGGGTYTDSGSTLSFCKGGQPPCDTYN